MRIWFRYFDRPDNDPDFVEVPEDTEIPHLVREIAKSGLDDPHNSGRQLFERQIDIWQLHSIYVLPVADDAQWRRVVKRCQGGKLGKVATRVMFGTVGRFKDREAGDNDDNDDEYFSLIVARVPNLDQYLSMQDEHFLGSLAELYPRRYRSLINHCQVPEDARTPSEVADSASFHWSRREYYSIYDGRHPPHKSPNLAPPVSLYHPIFQTWRKWAFDEELKPPRAVVAATAEFMRRASVLYADTDAHKEALRGPLVYALRRGISTEVNNDLIVTSGCISLRLELNGTVRNIPIIVDEQSQDVNADSSTEASFSMCRAWGDPDRDYFRDLTCCPTFLLGLDDAQLTVCGAVLTDKCIVNHLAMLWVGRESILDEEDTVNVARVFYALSLAINALSAWYKRLIASEAPGFTDSLTTHPRFFPSATSFPLNGDDFGAGVIEFEYLQPLQGYSTCATFLAQTKSVGDHVETFVVVKFAQRYCPEVHRLLAENGMAPNLLYCGPIDRSTPYESDWKLVVMDFFDGDPSYENDRHKEPNVRQQVMDIVATAHGGGFVLGDVRPPNVLINVDDKIKIVDFDWAGKEGWARYPAHISTGLWVDGVVPAGVIKKAHDEQMINRWFC